MSELKEGAVYKICHRQKGIFLAKLLRDGGLWCSVKIVPGGPPTPMGTEGDQFAVQRSRCTFSLWEDPSCSEQEDDVTRRP